MQFKQCFFILLATPLSILLEDRAGLAFDFKLPASADSPCTVNSFYCLSDSYSNSTFGTVNAYVKKVSKLPLGGTTSFLNLLNSSVWAKNGWKFQKAQPTQDIKGFFDIRVYKPYTVPYTGADIQFLYSPVIGQDPTGNNVHWIQRVVSNHALTTYRNNTWDLKPFGTREDKIDIVAEQKDPALALESPPKFNPYYDTFSPVANQISFEDFPTRPDPQDPHDWYAELYLVQETAPKVVTIYNGISWGWSNTFTPPPKPTTSLPPSSPCYSSGGSGGGGCVARNIYTDVPFSDFDSGNDVYFSDFDSGSDTPFADFDSIPFADFDSGNLDETSEKVPEPAIALGLFSLMVGGIIQTLKKKLTK